MRKLMTPDERKWAIEMAIRAGQTDLNAINDFASQLLQMSEGIAPEPKVTTLSQAKSLTPAQIEVLELIVKMHRNGETVNGSALAEKEDKTQSYMSAILRKLVALGYVGKEGYSFWPIYDAQGNEVLQD